eukprot:TRINITY_DN52674_c0_g1_i1.p1 TRINITY_DN52674_c0_g1~~TRINITY_DN52674_c0_g1_i1.p1  ORF type:complete len:345 (-),score=53.62 TRINITY_DN52674_c0_g1_i1:237-1271(-)
MRRFRAIAALVLFQGLEALRVGDTDDLTAVRTAKSELESDGIPGLDAIKSAASTAYSYVPGSGELLEWVANYLMHSSAAGYGIQAEPMQCKEGSGIGTTTTALACSTPSITLLNPPASEGFAMWRAPHLMKFMNFHLALECDMGAIKEFTMRKVKNKAYEKLGKSWDAWKDVYHGPPLCNLTQIEAEEPTIYYETASTKIDKETGVAKKGKISAALDKNEYSLSNMNKWLEQVTGPANDAPQDDPALNWKTVQIAIRQASIHVNGHKLSYEKTLGMDTLGPLMGTDGSDGMKNMYVAIIKFVTELAKDTIKHQVQSKAKQVVQGVEDVGRGIADFFTGKKKPEA